MFSEREIRFIMQPHQENTTTDRGLKPMRDLRQLGCSEKVFIRILEDRARKLGDKFTEFRASNQPAPNGEVVPIELSAASIKLF